MMRRKLTFYENGIGGCSDVIFGDRPHTRGARTRSRLRRRW